MPQTSVRALKKAPRLDDEVRFLRSWIEKPLHMGAVMPSGRPLARTMAQYVDVDDKGPVVELGPGTGAITSALIDRGIDQRRLVLVEYNPGFCALLRDRYPQARIVQGDAYRLRDTLWNVLSAPASAVVSGLPLVMKPMLTRVRLIRDAFAALLSGTVQLSSGSLPPAAPHVKPGTCRCLAVTGDARWPDLSDVPTMEEQGYRDFVFATDTVLLAPAKTPREIVVWLEQETLKVLGTPEMKERLYQTGFQVRPKGAKDAWARLTKEIELYKNIIEQAGIKRM